MASDDHLEYAEGFEPNDCKTNDRNPNDCNTNDVARVWPMVSLPDANWEAPYSARFQVGASAPGD